MYSILFFLNVTTCQHRYHRSSVSIEHLWGELGLGNVDRGDFGFLATKPCNARAHMAHSVVSKCNLYAISMQPLCSLYAVSRQSLGSQHHSTTDASCTNLASVRSTRRQKKNSNVKAKNSSPSAPKASRPMLWWFGPFGFVMFVAHMSFWGTGTLGE